MSSADSSPEKLIEELYYRTEEKRIPLIALLEVTYRCNLRCIHCYVVEDVNRRELTTSEMEGLLDQLALEGCLFLTLSGGEVLAREDFFHIARYAQKKSFALRLFTNGTLITPRSADRIAELRPLAVGISIHGARAKTHETITRVPGSFRRSVRAVKLLKERGLSVIVRWSLMKPNFHEHQALMDLAGELGVQPQFDPMITPRNDGSRESTRLRLTDEMLFSLYSNLLSGDSPDPHKEPAPPEQKLVCSAGFNQCAVSPYGDVYPCVAFPLIAGNLQEKSLSEIWRSSPSLSTITSMKTFADIDGCAECKLLTDCQRCPGVALLEDGDLYGKSTEACRQVMARKLAREKPHFRAEGSLRRPLHGEEKV